MLFNRRNKLGRNFDLNEKHNVLIIFIPLLIKWGVTEKESCNSYFYIIKIQTLSFIISAKRLNLFLIELMFRRAIKILSELFIRMFSQGSLNKKEIQLNTW